MFTEKSGFVSNQLMWQNILADLVAGGFTLISVNGTLSSAVPTDGKLTSFVVAPSDSVDPLVKDQPWRLAIKVAPNSTRMYAASPAQISDLGVVSKTGTVRIAALVTAPSYSGAIGSRTQYSGTTTTTVKDADGNDTFESYFWHRGLGVQGSASGNTPQLTGTMAYPDGSVDSLIFSDFEAIPMSYSLSISGHGFALHTRIEGQDNIGCRQAWVVIQRAINSDGTVVKTGKAPLFAMFSTNGGGAPDNNSIVYQGNGSEFASFSEISRFTVRESDVNAPTRPVSAWKHTADATAVINPLQQVAFSETNQFDFRLPQGFNTQRYSYPYEMDMVGYASADVISNGTEIEATVYGEAAPRKYKALSANSPNNTGMRLFLLSQGGGV